MDSRMISSVLLLIIAISIKVAATASSSVCYLCTYDVNTTPTRDCISSPENTATQYCSQCLLRVNRHYTNGVLKISSVNRGCNAHGEPLQNRCDFTDGGAINTCSVVCEGDKCNGGLPVPEIPTTTRVPVVTRTNGLPDTTHIFVNESECYSCNYSPYDKQPTEDCRAAPQTTFTCKYGCKLQSYTRKNWDGTKSLENLLRTCNPKRADATDLTCKTTPTDITCTLLCSGDLCNGEAGVATTTRRTHVPSSATTVGATNSPISRAISLSTLTSSCLCVWLLVNLS